jgi:hypothetical protein
MYVLLLTSASYLARSSVGTVKYLQSVGIRTGVVSNADSRMREFTLQITQTIDIHIDKLDGKKADEAHEQEMF